MKSLKIVALELKAFNLKSQLKDVTKKIELIKHPLKVNTAWVHEMMIDTGVLHRSICRALDLDEYELSQKLNGSSKLEAEEALDLARLFGVSFEEVLINFGLITTN
jgi:hypothetical protein